MEIDTKSKLFIIGIFIFGFITAIVLIYTFGNFAREGEIMAFENELSLARVPDVERSSVQAQPVDEMADWKTYRNEEYGFEMKYPPTLVYDFNPGSEGNLQVFRILSPGDKGKARAHAGLWIYIYKNYNNLNIKDWWNSSLGSKNGIYEVNDYDFLNNPAIKLIASSEILGNPTEYLISANKNFYRISTTYNNNLYSQILSTFKFIE